METNTSMGLCLLPPISGRFFIVQKEYNTNHLQRYANTTHAQLLSKIEYYEENTMIQSSKLFRPALALVGIVLTAPILAGQMQNHAMCSMQGHDMSKMDCMQDQAMSQMDCMKMDKGVMKCNMPGMASKNVSQPVGKMTGSADHSGANNTNGGKTWKTPTQNQ